MAISEEVARELAGLYASRRKISVAIDFARRTDAFRNAVDQHFNGTGSDASIRDALGGSDSMVGMLRTAAIERLIERMVDVNEEIEKAGGTP